MVRTTLLSCLAFTVAALLGRQAVLPGTQLALVWPAAGIGGVWLAAHAFRRWMVVDAVLLFAASTVTTGVTGASLPLAAGIGLAAVVQALALVLALSRWAPELVGFGSRPPDGLVRLRDVGVLLAAALASSVCSALIGPATVLAIRDQDWAVLASWVVRNTTGVLAVLPLALAVPWLLHRTGRRVLRTLGRAQWLELLLLLAATAAALWVVFGAADDLPLPFVVVPLCVWAGARFAPVPAGLHAVALATAVVVLTLNGVGPFAEVEDGSRQALVVQVYVAAIVLVTLSLAVARRESALLNAALVASERAATSQARLAATIVDSMADGVSVVDDAGRLVLRNPAAGRLLGAAQLDEQGVVISTRYRLLHPDGTPLAADEAPYVLARARDEVVRSDYLLSPEEGSEARTLDVTATPLSDAEPPMVVLVYHDVTAERRERDELAAFAGVVAHDLLNPLTVVEGWTGAMAADVQRGTSEPAVQLQHLERIQRAGRRMRALIDDLLAFATARDRALAPVPVDTTELVRDIAQTRVEAAAASDQPAPSVEVGELPPVLAEPVLLRQVLDNLVGNAVKYVAPGVRPVVTVAGRRLPERPGYVELTVSDNGIGIPAGQHAAVFQSFHRAHGNDYRGTGLGLSIVQRVVDRHGGTVTAGDRPGGGTTITVVLPAAPEPARG